MQGITNGLNFSLVEQLNSKQNEVKFVYGLLSSSGWSGNSQVVNFTGLTADQNAVIGISPSSTVVQDTAAAKAKLKVTGQSAGSMTIVANGTVPTINIPVVLMLF